MSAVPDALSGLETALTNANRLLTVDPRLAEEQAAEILKVIPNQPNALILQALANGQMNQWQVSVELLRKLTVLQPKWAAAFMELGLALRQLGLGNQAVTALKRSLFLKPDVPKAWLALADLHAAMGDAKAADAAYSMQLKYASATPHLMAAAGAMAEDNMAVAERALKNYLKQYPTDVAAIRMLAEVASRLGRSLEAEHLLARCLELSPSFHFARQNYAHVLNLNNRSEKVMEQADILLSADPNNLGYLNLKAVALSKTGDYAGAIALYERVLADHSGYSKIWHSFGHTLKTAGLTERSIEAYRRSIALEPTFGEAYWSLANLKTFRFSEADIAEMQAQMQTDKLSEEDRFHFDFALGKALEDQTLYQQAFQHYSDGNVRRKTMINYKADRNTLKIKQNKLIFTREFFEQRAGLGHSSAEPIFILGMPRAGSTLLEQILSSHSQVEGTMELPDVMAFTKELYRNRADRLDKTYFPSVTVIDAEQATAFGRRYLESTKIHRKAGKPRFIDKMPNNYAHIALIHLMLPNARIIDARRHPMACSFSNFKQHFARGQNFSYSLDDMGRYYRDYVELMAHFDEVLPGRILRVHYENIVADTENEVRRVLEYCGLPFEEGCLRFFENDRPVRTASSEQVRQPIYKEGVDHWRHFEPWLDPLKKALGPVFEQYPDVPTFN
jgi:tetratricopeptide (TPR) repeat protein